MKKSVLFLTTAIISLGLLPASANERYGSRPPVVVSPDLSAPWVIQLGHKPGKVLQRRQQGGGVQVQPNRRIERAPQPDRTQTAALRKPEKKQIQAQMNPIFLPQVVAYDGPHKPGTIIIDTTQNFLFLVEADGQARRYGVGTGKPGFEWAGTHKVSRKAEWPDWRPPAEMIVRERAKGHILPAMMPGGPQNPLGARAMYLGSTLYRIHGTNQPWTIGTAVSSGCIRMRNEDVVDLYERVNVGTTVIVI